MNPCDHPQVHPDGWAHRIAQLDWENAREGTYLRSEFLTFLDALPLIREPAFRPRMPVSSSNMAFPFTNASAYLFPLSNLLECRFQERLRRPRPIIAFEATSNSSIVASSRVFRTSSTAPCVMRTVSVDVASGTGFSLYLPV
ncbi:hypothetical protein N7509_012643 [Penicillium cosmopolitanum]|uniref:Uncharacterized protein n=1 Tax=Penicillium cosmopolitanum TaxID=1131564 RepID=A0A9W9VG53_9EURO|nr:uncharacterized protein N7509_012643 [Penicillium cosmopolitanum]KAJ5379524.1 hypothetical protein N7509_012643 [Penicillium cosmopolitanum]